MYECFFPRTNIHRTSNLLVTYTVHNTVRLTSQITTGMRLMTRVRIIIIMTMMMKRRIILLMHTHQWIALLPFWWHMYLMIVCGIQLMMILVHWLVRRTYFAVTSLYIPLKNWRRNMMIYPNQMTWKKNQ